VWSHVAPSVRPGAASVAGVAGVLGGTPCGACDDGTVRPVWIRDEETGRILLDRATCDACLVNVVMPSMTPDEWRQQVVAS